MWPMMHIDKLNRILEHLPRADESAVCAIHRHLRMDGICCSCALSAVIGINRRCLRVTGLHFPFAHSKEQGHAPHPPAGDHEDHPYGSPGLRPVFMASVEAYEGRYIGTYGWEKSSCEASPLQESNNVGSPR